MNAPDRPSIMAPAGLPKPPQFDKVEDERLHRKQWLAVAFRLFSKFGFDEGVADHITARDPEHTDTFWVNPFGVHFSQVKVSNLIRCDDEGNVVEGKHPLNRAAFAIHSRLHMARPFSALGRLLEMISQDHALYDDFGGVVVELDEGKRIAKALGKNKAAILQNHGLLTVGKTVDEAAWWFICMERSSHVQLLTEAAVRPGEKLKLINEKAAEQYFNIVGSSFSGWFQFQPLYVRILKEQPDFLN